MSMIKTGPLVLLFLLCAGARGSDSVIDVTVDVARPGPTFSRHVFGQFAEDLGAGIYGGIWVGRDAAIPNTRGIRNDVVAALKALHVPNVRWPGGCYADEYHWQDGIGAKSKRRVESNFNWGGVKVSNEFGTDEFMDFVEQIGSEAYISVNVGSGTVREAADWLQYLTGDADTAWGAERSNNGHRAPYRVALLGIGNESWDCGGHMSGAEYSAELKRYAKFVHNWNTQQPMQKIAVGPSDAKTEYTEAVMRTWKENADWDWSLEGLSLHSYTVGPWPPSWSATDFGQAEYAKVIADTLKMDDLISLHSRIMDQYDPGKKISLVVDEWGAWYAPTKGSNPGFLQQQNSQRDAILAALNLNIFSRHADRVRNANIAQMINVLQAMILTDGPRMLLTPTYHVFRMYVPFQDSKLLPVSYVGGRTSETSLALPRIDVIAAKPSAGGVVISLVNLDSAHAAHIDLRLPGEEGGTLEGETLAAPSVDSINTFERPAVVVPKPILTVARGGKYSLSIPPASVTILTSRRH